MLISDVLRGKGNNVVTAAEGDKVSTVVQALAEHRIGAVVVTGPKGIAGIFSERDLLNALAKVGAPALDQPVGDLMTSPVVTGRPGDRIEAALHLMTTKRLRHLPVLDQERLAGLVSLGDLVKHRLDEKEMEANVMLDLSRMRS